MFDIKYVQYIIIEVKTAIFKQKFKGLWALNKYISLLQRQCKTESIKKWATRKQIIKTMKTSDFQLVADIRF